MSYDYETTTTGRQMVQKVLKIRGSLWIAGEGDEVTYRRLELQRHTSKWEPVQRRQRCSHATRLEQRYSHSLHSLHDRRHDLHWRWPSAELALWLHSVRHRRWPEREQQPHRTMQEQHSDRHRRVHDCSRPTGSALERYVPRRSWRLEARLD